MKRWAAGRKEGNRVWPWSGKKAAAETLRKGPAKVNAIGKQPLGLTRDLLVNCTDRTEK